MINILYIFLHLDFIYMQDFFILLMLQLKNNFRAAKREIHNLIHTMKKKKQKQKKKQYKFWLFFYLLQKNKSKCLIFYSKSILLL